ncbi:MAG: hypothetical protein IJ738_04065 [Alphaproteobacteria bacterium]|nr:hypothetical protein [Alphaproteobacteria bacterium]
MNVNEEIDEIERRLSEGNINAARFNRWLSDISILAEEKNIEPDKFFTLCQKLRFTDKLAEDTYDKETIRKMRESCSDAIFGLVKNKEYDQKTRYEALSIYKNIVTSEKRVQDEGCEEIFHYLLDGKCGIKEEKDSFIKAEIKDIVHFLISRNPQNKSNCLFALYIALTDKNVEVYDCLNYIDNITQSHSYSKDEAKTIFSICDEIVEQSPILRKQALEIIKDIYNNTRDEAAHVRAENILYRIAQNYPFLKEAIENDILRSVIKEPKIKELPDKEWMFIGKDKPCNEKFKPIHSDYSAKIRGGLYTSPKKDDGLSEWNHYLIDENWDVADTFYVEPKENIKCLIVNSFKDIEPYTVSIDGRATIEAKALAKDYDCVCIMNPRGSGNGGFTSEYEAAFWDYDVSSLIFLKPNTFTAYTEEEYAQHKALQQKMEKVRQMSNPQKMPKQRSPINNAYNSKNNTNSNSGFDGGR